MNVEETAAAALARPVGPELRRHGVHFQWPSDAEIDRELGDYERYDTREPLSPELEAAGEWQDAEADRLYGEPGDPLLDCDDVPAGYDPTWWKAGL